MEWIKCSEKMPDLYQWVLVCNSPKGTGEPRSINIWRWDGNDWDCIDTSWNSPTFSDIIYSMFTDEITHWMPLPLPPIQDLSCAKKVEMSEDYKKRLLELNNLQYFFHKDGSITRRNEENPYHTLEVEE